MPTQRVNDVDLQYLDLGAGDPVLLLHGAGGRGADLWLQSEPLSRRYRVIAPDQRGHGGSTVVATPYGIDALAADAAALCRALSLGPCHVVGHSLGGLVGLALALDFPAQVRSLAFLNATSFGGGASLQSALVKLFLKTFGMRAFAKANTRLHLPEPGQAELRARLVETMGTNPVAGYLATQRALEAFDVRPRLAEVNCPVLVVHSEQDVIPRADKELVAARVQHGTLLTIPASRHIVIWDQPERLNEALLGFLARS